MSVWEILFWAYAIIGSWLHGSLFIQFSLDHELVERPFSSFLVVTFAALTWPLWFLPVVVIGTINSLTR